jgi:hypothetical protein
MARAYGKGSPSSAYEVDAAIAELDPWQRASLTRIRELIREADPRVVEEIKWRKPSNPSGVPVWSHDGIICTGESHSKHLRLTFARGAALADPAHVFNSGFAGKTLRAVVLKEGETVDETAFRALFRAAVRLNESEADG